MPQTGKIILVYSHFNAPTWCFKTGFGGRIIPSRCTVEGLPAPSNAPVGPVLPSILRDANGEAVTQKAQEEAEMHPMAKMDFPSEPGQQQAPPAQPVLVGYSSANVSSMVAGLYAGMGTLDQEEELDMSFLEDMVPQENIHGLEFGSSGNPTSNSSCNSSKSKDLTYTSSSR